MENTAGNTSIESILASVLGGTPISDVQQNQLIRWELADQHRARAWGINENNVTEQIQTRLTWLQAMVPLHCTMPLPPHPMETYLILYWQLWLPLALTLALARKQLNAPLIQGILGGQGTGKTTLTQILSQILKAMGYGAVGLSIDDLYKTYSERCQLRQADPRLKWRGPPGTHDVDLGIATLEQVRSAAKGETVALPRFDKSLHGGEGDRTSPELVQDVDILLFEGWFLGVRPVDPARFNTAPEPICTEADRQFAQDINARLAMYLPLWNGLDRLMVIYPEDYRISKSWRRQAEHQMRAQGKEGMDDATIDEFVEYFWRALHPDLFITPLKYSSGYVDLVVEIDLNRHPSAIYSPK